ncbi:MAG: hypothetical protein F4X44_00995 [Gammaproteobacteria bacterium]|nr:hypothetical protein [Gammaproteobacteria bacterium]MYD79180.1 hypothetical protein [Gammaproteobacteria bacterium]
MNPLLHDLNLNNGVGSENIVTGMSFEIRGSSDPANVSAELLMNFTTQPRRRFNYVLARSLSSQLYHDGINVPQFRSNYTDLGIRACVTVNGLYWLSAWTCLSFKPSTDDLLEESQLRDDLQSYLDLENDWDMNGAMPPSPLAVEDLLVFLENRPSDIPIPFAQLGKDGEVGVYWNFKDSGILAEVSTKGDGKFEYIAVSGLPSDIREYCGYEGLDVTEFWPEDMLRILRSRAS